MELARKLRPALVILDFSMPRMNGLGDAAASIRAALPDVKILLFTLPESEVLREQAEAIGVDGYVSKSEESSQLLAAVAALRAGRRLLPKTRKCWPTTVLRS